MLFIFRNYFLDIEIFELIHGNIRIKVYCDMMYTN